MLFLVFEGLFVLLAVLCFLCKARYPRSEWDRWGASFCFVAILSVITVLTASGVGRSNQINDYENVKKFQKVEAIYQAKAEMLTAEFVKHLAETYPKHEKEIYNKISPEKVALYFVKYPELRASETLVVLVDRINKLQSDVYDQRINVEEALKNTRVRLRSPWLFTFMIPTE